MAVGKRTAKESECTAGAASAHGSVFRARGQTDERSEVSGPAVGVGGVSKAFACRAIAGILVLVHVLVHVLVRVYEVEEDASEYVTSRILQLKNVLQCGSLRVRKTVPRCWDPRSQNSRKLYRLKN